MDAAHYLAELQRLLAQADNLPDGRKLIDSHGNEWEVRHGTFLHHESNEKRVLATAHGGWLAFRVEDIEI